MRKNFDLSVKLDENLQAKIAALAEKRLGGCYGARSYLIRELIEQAYKSEFGEDADGMADLRTESK